jgi:peptide/nickel transport system ATP-binding protein
MLKLSEITKTYKVGTFGGKSLYAVRKVSFDIKDGEVISLIGESGSGKSTIGRMILKLTSITSGSIEFNGQDISTIKKADLKDYYSHVQGVFQDPFSSCNPIFKADRIFEIMHEEFFPSMPREEWDEKLVEALHCVGLNPEHVQNKFPHQLSGGQLQRFLIARALLLDLKFLVADEIISMLDASTRIDVLNLLADLKSHGLSILFITHDLSLGYYISERAVILYKGTVVEMGETDKIYHTPLHPYTQMLMASVPHLDHKWEQKTTDLGGKVEDITEGCVYFSRCPLEGKGEQCRADIPPLVEVEPGHQVACCCFQK